MSVVISIRIPRWLKEKLESYGINISELVKRKLFEELENIERENAEKILSELRSLEGKVDLYELAKIIDEEHKG
ncbi:MAG: antitoxin [Sulfolobales archaeon]